MGAPGLFRTFVFPAARLLVWGAMAVALLWLAFGRSSQADAGPPTTPSAVLEPPAAQIVRGDVTNTVQLTGAVAADPATTVKVTATGQVGTVRATVGQSVEKGTPLFTVVVPVEDTAPPTVDALGNPAPTAPKTRTVTVTAPTPGTLATLDVLPDQAVSVGEAVATVSPGTLTVSAPLTQEQQFRLLAPPSAAQVTVPGGPQPFECSDLRTGAATSANSTNPGTDDAAPTTGARLTCRVPDGVQAFAGLTATVDVSAGAASGVLLAPVTAVEGSLGAGTVWVVGDSGEPVETPVTLGLTDGTNVEITSGVQEGAQVLQFVPDSDGELAGDETGDAAGNVVSR